VATIWIAVGQICPFYSHRTGKRGEAVSHDAYQLLSPKFEQSRLAESLIKQMTGQDKIAARFLRAEFFEFTPTFKIWLATNHKPAIRGTDYAIWRRIRLIPFGVTIPDIDQDKELGVKLLAELDGILTWAVQGCLEWQRDGLGMPAEVKKATRAYQDEMDIIGSFLDDCCIITETATTRASQLYQAYQDWCEDNGERPMSNTRFGRRMGERGFDKVKDTYVYYLGLGLLANWEEGEIPF
jgi:putative DNA primase/helicase